MLFGQDFDGRALLPQIGEQTQLGGSVEDVVAILDAAAQAAGCVGLMMIDALNESEGAHRWSEDLRVLRAVVDRYRHIGLVVSCRTEFVDAVLGEEDLPMFEHVGFAEATDLAVRRFTQEYELETPTFPVLNPEFGNPLFLKLTCEALATLGATRFPFGTAGLATVCRAFLEAVNKRLAEPSRSDYDERSDPVDQVVRDLALLDARVFDREDVVRITNAVLSGRSWSKSLMRGLLSEGVLIELGDGRIAFGYQRLGDVVRATDLSSRGRDAVLAWHAEREQSRWLDTGLLGALSVVVPEQHGVELFDLVVDDDGAVSADVADAFLESLLLRSADHVTERAVAVVGRLLEEGHYEPELWDRLVRIACVPGHPLNATWLHQYLAPQELAKRDASWSTWLVGLVGADEETSVRRIIEWAWPSDLEAREPLSDEVAVLSTQLLGWLLATTDRRVRDRATKAIVSVADRAPGGFAKGVAEFRGVNDPYVIERLAAAACGAALRGDDADRLRQVADGLAEMLGGESPDHLLTRDYARRVYDRASASGWTGPEGRPPYGAEWPVDARSIADIEALSGPPDYEYGSIWHSLTGMGDFGHYVVEPALRDVYCADPQALREQVERTIFDQVLNLGWTPERFTEIDSGRRGGCDGVVERVGKKYQWIGFYEVLGRVADNFQVKRRWGDDEPRPYEYPEQLVWRDIDPTVLARPMSSDSETAALWFAPAVAEFPATVVDEYPSDMRGVPDPLDLLAVVSPAGDRSLVLVANHHWDQPLPPEVQALEVPRLDVWMQVHAYLTPVDAVEGLREWVQGKDWFGRWMPEVVEQHNVLLGAHPNDPEWEAASGAVEWWEERLHGPQPADLRQCAAWYGGTGTSLDASSGEETRGYVPTTTVVDSLSLARGLDFRWNDSAGVAVHDPSVVNGGPAGLVMRRDLAGALRAAGWAVLWTVLVGNELNQRNLGPPGDDYRWVSASASYLLNGDRIEQLHATASRCSAGPTVEASVDWPTTPSEP